MADVAEMVLTDTMARIAETVRPARGNQGIWEVSGVLPRPIPQRSDWGVAVVVLQGSGTARSRGTDIGWRGEAQSLCQGTMSESNGAHVWGLRQMDP